jgi:tetratricopeptide (TPR) repeat protein
MSEPHGAGSARAADALSGFERDARVEQLLLQGLDCYFAGDYDQAIHVWTRVLFLDRGHTRARAYIERARGTLAERQRESEELLHRGVAAFDRGDAGDARSLLNAAVQHGVSPDVALSYLGRLDRLAPNGDAAGGFGAGDAAPELAAPAQVAAAPARPPRRVKLLLLCLLALTVPLAWVGTVMFEVSDFREALRLQRVPPVRTAPDPETPLPLPRPAELALDRARELFASGHPLDALRLLGAIGVADPLRPDADRLRADIQRSLLRPVEASLAAEAAGAEP